MSSHETDQKPVKDASRRATMKTLGLGSLTALATSIISGGAKAQSEYRRQPQSPETGMQHRHFPMGERDIPDNIPLARLNNEQKNAVRMAMLPPSASIEAVAPYVAALTPAARRLTLRDLDALRMGNMVGGGLGQLTARDLTSIGTAFGQKAVNSGGSGPANMGCCCCCCFCAWCSGGSHGGSAVPK